MTTRAQREDRRDRVRARALELLLNPLTVVLDTETTDLRGGREAIEAAVISTSGEVLFDSLIASRKPLEPQAQETHGISPWDLVTAPSPAECAPSLHAALGGRMITAYNVRFDVVAVNNTLRASGAAALEPTGTGCIMELYAEWVGERYWRDTTEYRNHKLTYAATEFAELPEDPRHRALTDVRMALCVLRGLAGRKAE